MIARRIIGVLAAALALLAPALPLAAETVAPPAHEEIRLWPGTPPGNGKVTGPEVLGDKGAGYGAVSNVSTPRMRVFRPAKPNGAAVLVAGGGGYFRIQLKKESTPSAEWLQAQGFTVFELIYRLPNDGWDAAAPFMDAQRAMKIIRTRAGEFGVDPQRIGIIGFSAGGHLASMAATLQRCVSRVGGAAFLFSTQVIWLSMCILQNNSLPGPGAIRLPQRCNTCISVW